MRDRWYSDDRDVVKWAALLHLAERHKISHILHVVFYTPEQRTEKLQTSTGPVPIDPEVWKHFRDVGNTTLLTARKDIFQTALMTPFSEPRGVYTSGIRSSIRESERRPLIAFLDPDTGIAPNTRTSWKHVTPEEIRYVYDSLSTGEILALYQHAWRSKNWLKEATAAFADALDRQPDKVDSLTCPEVAKDVAILVAQRR